MDRVAWHEAVDAARLEYEAAVERARELESQVGVAQREWALFLRESDPTDPLHFANRTAAYARFDRVLTARSEAAGEARRLLDAWKRLREGGPSDGVQE